MSKEVFFFIILLLSFSLQLYEGLKQEKCGVKLDYRYDTGVSLLCNLCCTFSVFPQNYSSQVRIGANDKSVNFPVSLFCRWSSRYDQWWECKFLSEGIIDQG